MRHPLERERECENITLSNVRKTKESQIMMASYCKESGAIDDNRNKMANQLELYSNPKSSMIEWCSPNSKHPLQKLLLKLIELDDQAEAFAMIRVVSPTLQFDKRV